MDLVAEDLHQQLKGQGSLIQAELRTRQERKCFMLARLRSWRQKADRAQSLALGFGENPITYRRSLLVDQPRESSCYDSFNVSPRDARNAKTILRRGNNIRAGSNASAATTETNMREAKTQDAIAAVARDHLENHWPAR
jgi:hypothetical protein